MWLGGVPAPTVPEINVHLQFQLIRSARVATFSSQLVILCEGQFPNNREKYREFFLARVKCRMDCGFSRF
jgi:hypothetical protein